MPVLLDIFLEDHKCKLVHPISERLTWCCPGVQGQRQQCASKSWILSISQELRFRALVSLQATLQRFLQFALP
jgi:hypothetical protein